MLMYMTVMYTCSDDCHFNKTTKHSPYSANNIKASLH